MSITNGYTTLAAYKAFAAPTAATDANDDAVIEAIIEAASRAIDRQTCRFFYKEASDSTRYFTATETNCLEVPDLVSITTLATDDGLRTYGTTWTTNDFDLLPYNAATDGLPYRRIHVSPIGSYTFYPSIEKGVKIVGKFGWPAVPDDIELACQVITKAIYNGRFGQNESAVATITSAGVVVSPRDFPAEAWTLINPFRKRQ